MSDSSAIEWTDATWNPVTGCTKVSQGCKNCYAERDWVRLSANPKSVYYLRKFTDVAVHADRLDQPGRWSKPRRIFVNSMSDLFHEDVPEDFIARVWQRMAWNQQHIFQILTKRPGRMLEWLTACGRDAVFAGEREEYEESISLHGWPLRNVWLGVSVEDQATADERIRLLLQTPAAVRWISAEPLLEYIIVTPYFRSPFESQSTWALDWVVAGGESGPAARPSRPLWFRALRKQCAEFRVPFFFKQWGEWIPSSDVPSGYADTYSSETRGSRNRSQVVGDELLVKVGKKAAGRLLDGRTHDEYPA